MNSVSYAYELWLHEWVNYQTINFRYTIYNIREKKSYLGIKAVVTYYILKMVTSGVMVIKLKNVGTTIIIAKLSGAFISST